MKSLRWILLLPWAWPVPVSGQAAPVSMSPFAGSAAEDTLPPNTSYPLGESEMIANNMMVSMRLEQRQRDLCLQYGCLVIVNESTSYRITEFRVRESAKDGTLRWSDNQFRQFGVSLYPKKATFFFKTGKPETCDWPVMFVLKDLKRRDSISVEGRAALCSSPHRNSLVRVKVIYPSVTVGPS
jgi:hypothetical protein